MKSNYVSVLNLLLENEVERAKSLLEDIIKDYEKSNHNVPRSVYNHDTNNIFEAIGLDKDETFKDMVSVVAEMALAKVDSSSETIEYIEKKPWSVSKKMFIYHLIAQTIDKANEGDIGI